MFLETATAAIADSAVKEVYVIGEADGYTSIASLAGAAARGAGAGRSRRRRRAAVLLGHDRPGEGRDAHAPQPRREHRADARPPSPVHEDDGLRGGAAVLPHLRHAGAHEPGPAGRRHDRHDAALRSRAVPGAASGASASRRAFVAPPMVVALAKHPDRRQLRPLRAAVDLLGRGAAVRRARDRVRPAARLRGRAGLRHDRAVPGEPRHAAGPVQARLGRRHGAEHRGPHRRSRDAGARSASTRTARSGSAARR